MIYTSLYEISVISQNIYYCMKYLICLKYLSLHNCTICLLIVHLYHVWIKYTFTLDYLKKNYKGNFHCLMINGKKGWWLWNILFIWFSLVWFSFIWFSFIWFSFIWFSLIGLVWFGLVCFGLVWSGLVRISLVWLLIGTVIYFTT